MKKKIIITESVDLGRLYRWYDDSDIKEDLFLDSVSYLHATLVLEDSISNNKISLDLGLHKSMSTFNRLYRVIVSSNVMSSSLRISVNFSKVRFDGLDSFLKDYIF